MRTAVEYLRHLAASFRMLLVFTALLGVVYPLVVFALSQVSGLSSKANGSTLSQGGHTVASALIGQSFTDSKGNPLKQYFQSRPSAAGAGYDPTASAASNLGPESIVDVLPNPAVKGDTGKPSLLTQVCTRSLDLGQLYGVSGARPFCTSAGVGAVLSVTYVGPGYTGQVTGAVSLDQACPATPFIKTYQGVTVTCAKFGGDYARGQLVPIKGDAPSKPAVPADAVTSSGSGLDPDISPAYAKLQENVVAQARGISVTTVAGLVHKYMTGRTLGFMGEPVVNVVTLNAALDRRYPVR